MCGINGVFHYRQGEPDRERVIAQAHAQRHRGPDDWDVWCEGPVALGQRRLSIVDVSPGGHQPMANEDRSVWVTFNGELYNWPEARPQLAARGHQFRGNSDTEMLLHLWEEKGPALVDDLRGMFAFALYDTRQRRLMLARDRVGKFSPAAALAFEALRARVHRMAGAREFKETAMAILDLKARGLRDVTSRSGSSRRSAAGSSRSSASRARCAATGTKARTTSVIASPPLGPKRSTRRSSK